MWFREGSGVSTRPLPGMDSTLHLSYGYCAAGGSGGSQYRQSADPEPK